MRKKITAFLLACVIMITWGMAATVSAAENPAAATVAETQTNSDKEEGSRSLPAVAKIPDQPYTGKAIQPEISLDNGGDTLTEGVGYTVSYQDNMLPGTAAVMVTGQDNYAGSRQTAEFQIIADLASVEIDPIPGQVFTGTELEPSLQCSLDGHPLQKDVDYTVTFSDNIHVGTATATLYGIGNYTGQRTVSFSIVPAALPTIDEIGKQAYTGKAVEPAVVLKNGSILLENGVDYQVSYQNNIKIGTATVTVTGLGDYEGTQSATFSIVPAKVTGLTTVNTTNTVKLSWKKVSEADGYIVYRWNSKTQKWTKLKTTASCTYTDKNLTAGTSYKHAVKAYKKVDGTTYSASYPTITTATKPSKVALTNVTCKSGNKVTITWNKRTATGYQVYRATKKNGTYTKIATIRDNNTVKYVDKNCVSGKTYYYKVRAYKTADGTNYFGAFSKIGKKIVPRIMITIGHGRSMDGTVYDSGAVNGKYQEFKLAKEIGKYAQTYYQSHYGGSCEIMNYDGKMGLKKRVSKLKDNTYSLVCEIHLNAGGAAGTEVYYTTRDKISKKYAAKVAAQIAKDLKVNNRGAKKTLNASGKDDLMFLRETKPSAILVETVYIDNNSDLAKVKNAAGQKKAGIAIAKALGAVSAQMDS